jgi:deoxyribodipyrimidine photo-lyase
MVPDIRIRAANDRPVRKKAKYVVYWMVAYRRLHENFALERAVEWARRLERPLVILEPLRCDYRWASDRLHRFVVQGMRDNLRASERTPAFYYPYLEPEPGKGKGLLEALARQACVVVTDEFPSFFLPRMVRAAAKKLAVRLETVDSNGLLPMRAADRDFTTAHSFRRFLQKNLRPHLDELPRSSPLSGSGLPSLADLPARIVRRWPPASREWLIEEGSLESFPIDHSVAPTVRRGGERAARKDLRWFLNEALDGYADRRSTLEDSAGSGLSPYLHFGHVSPHEIFRAVAQYELWCPERIAETTDGNRTGWWGMRAGAESFLDQLVTWRELGYQSCSRRSDYHRYDSLPAWARQTLAEHAADPRPHIYTLRQLEAAETADPLWNAAQTQLVRDGTIHNYLRMLWGKKILEWTSSPRRALQVMIHLNNKYALDGRNPNSYSGIFWVLGRYDRPWGPERPVFGKIRYMSSENTARKMRTHDYLARYGDGAQKTPAARGRPVK